MGHMSRPARGGWIEMKIVFDEGDGTYSPVPRGAGGLKFFHPGTLLSRSRPVPRGAGGLK